MDNVADYKILEHLYGMGTTQHYLAEPPERLSDINNRVIVTTHLKTLGRNSFAKLCLHLAAVGECDSEHIGKLYEVGQTEEYFYISSEGFTQGTLNEPTEVPSRTDVLEIVAAACSGAHSLHQAGLIHGDINPRNIFLDDPAKLANPGILAVISPGQTLDGTTSSTPIDYKAPSNIQGEIASRATDIWSLGVTLHKALTGQLIYPDAPTDSLLVAVRYILNNKPQMSDALRNGERLIVEKSLGLHDDVFTTAEELGEAIRSESLRQMEAA